MSATAQPNTYTMRDYRFGDFTEKLAKLARRAAKLGVREPRATIVETFEQKVGNDAYQQPIFGTFYKVHIDAEPVKVDGYTFGATIDHQNEGGNVIRTAPGIDFEIPERFRDAPSFCTHCNSLRTRRYTFVLRCDATGDFAQIGKNCLADFIGRDANDLAARAGWFSTLGGDDDDDFDGAYGMRDDSTVDLLTFLEHSAAVIRVYGWVSATIAKTDETLTSTRSRALNNMYPPRCRVTGKYEKVERVTDADKALAARALDWALSHEGKAGLSEYLHNVLVIARSTYIAFRSCGIAASIVSGCLRAEEKLVIARREAVDTANSVHIGTEKQRIDFGPCRVVTAFSGETSGGWMMHVYTFATAEGNLLRWSASSSQGLVKGTNVSLIGTVKSHDEYNGQKRTKITRCKVEPIPA